MYDELISALRNNADHYGYEAEDVLVHLLTNAADAIEELWKKYLASEVDATNLTGWLAEEHAKRLWIPVTERLPESVHEYVLCCGAKGGQFVGWVGTGFITGGKVMAFQHGGKGRYITHWMPLPTPPKEET